MMAKFKCKTQTRRMQGFRGPSGEQYVSMKGEAFRVDTKQDVEYFDNKRQFERQGVKEAAKRVVDKAKEVVVGKEPESSPIMDWLDQVKGLSQASKDKIINRYEELESFLSYLHAGDRLTDLIPEKQAIAIKEFWQEGGSFPRETGGGWYELSNGEKVRGKDEAIIAQKKIEEE